MSDSDPGPPDYFEPLSGYSWFLCDDRRRGTPPSDELPRPLFDTLVDRHMSSPVSNCRTYATRVDAMTALRRAWAQLPENDKAAIRVIYAGKALAAAL